MRQVQHFVLEGSGLSEGVLRIEDRDLLHQMKSVLRFNVGDECVVLDGRGKRAKGVIEELHKKAAVIALSELEECEAEGRRLHLFCALSKKPSTFEMIVQKAVELGVTDIWPLATERTQVKEVRKMERVLAIIKEATEQSERCFLPELHEVLNLEAALALKLDLYVGDAWKSAKKLGDFDLNGDLGLVIGPEGGLSEAELEKCEGAGAEIFVLGDTVLRMETAAIAALSVVQFG